MAMIISSIGLYYLLDCDYLRQYEVAVFYYFLNGKSHFIGQYHCHWHIPADILRHFNKIVDKYNKFNVCVVLFLRHFNF